MIRRTAQGFAHYDDAGQMVAGPFRTFSQAAGAILPQAPPAPSPREDKERDDAPKRKRAPRKRKTTPKEG